MRPPLQQTQQMNFILYMAQNLQLFTKKYFLNYFLDNFIYEFNLLFFAF